jgi:hypothetical protein
MAEVRKAPDTLQAMFDRAAGLTRESHPALRQFSGAIGKVERGIFDPMFRQVGRDIAKGAFEGDSSAVRDAAIGLTGAGMVRRIGGRSFAQMLENVFGKGSSIFSKAGKHSAETHVIVDYKGQTLSREFTSTDELKEFLKRADEAPIIEQPTLKVIQGGKVGTPPTFGDLLARQGSKTRRRQTFLKTGKVQKDGDPAQRTSDTVQRLSVLAKLRTEGSLPPDLLDKEAARLVSKLTESEFKDLVPPNIRKLLKPPSKSSLRKKYGGRPPLTRREQVDIQGGPLSRKLNDSQIGKILDEHGIEWVHHENGGITAIEKYSRGPDTKKYFRPNTSLRTIRDWLGY